MGMKKSGQGHVCVEELEERCLLSGEWLKFAPAAGFEVTEPGADKSPGTHKAGPIANGRYWLGLFPDPPRPIAEPTDPEKQVLQKWYPAPAWKFVYATPLD